MRVKFWGVRGSIPTPGPDTVGIGGNTSCVEVDAGGRLLIFDGGTGLRGLGKELVKSMPLTAHIFFSHVHWDHIQGFPFFDPAFVPGNQIHLYGGSNVSRTLEETLAGQMDHPSFPVHLTDMAARMTFNDLDEGATLVLPAEPGSSDGDDEVRITTARGNHPNGVYAYRVDHGGHSVVYATDTEHYDEVDPALLALSKGADVLINDAQYTPEEYEGRAGTGGSKRGWGHSTFVASAELAKAAGVKQLVLFHHDPLQNDASVRDKQKRAQEHFANTIAAYEGLVIDL
jgi:phosphoribosyl 1,2-cyclic phosphodiesterase